MTSFVPAISMQPRITVAPILMRWTPILLLVAFAALLFFVPDLAFAQDAKAKVGANAQKSYDLVFTWAYYICAAAIVLTGLGTMSGRMEPKTFGFVALGIGIIFSGTAIVDWFK
ncbi:hypothetical protein LMG31884_47590 (plasmid) [Xanthomonas hydrangeae]|uniref:TrbC/VirB2 family protein n=1 Tax=Xanthomonas hydrangeae TaxID=2775159 RepID=UPI0019647B9A|nr:hypothetical protein LMG31884_47590 [Xanthomonas hydrangeae]CAD7741351.1 hypothetical protein LMG31884_47590 [Xanthomonas hydrangeae]CAD7747906.1 hypothetical protein LMG31887_46240 [Xanthomonas hydrangeae]CAD7747907.1 hypothetical protein LMG31887_46240 [Xanthomonas hydrangeae]CAD7748216.1 hypothetical protein LMG31885_45250 [Xanthomonas hydrangeae]